jgi:hypothetical protein
LDIPIIASGGVGNLEHLVQGVTPGMPTRCWRPAFFTMGNTRCDRPRSRWRRIESRCACDAERAAVRVDRGDRMVGGRLGAGDRAGCAKGRC